jgi:hypothetical protein
VHGVGLQTALIVPELAIVKFVAHVIPSGLVLVHVAFAGQAVQGLLPDTEKLTPTVQGSGSQVAPVVLFSMKFVEHVGVPDTGHVARSVGGHGVHGGLPVGEYDEFVLHDTDIFTIVPLLNDT